MKIFYLLILIVAWPIPGKTEPVKLSVNVIAWGSETNAVSSYAKRELRDLKDVDIVDADTPNCYQISICVQTLNSRPAFYCVNANFLFQQQDTTTCALFLGGVATNGSDLKTLVEDSVTQFDSLVLERARQRRIAAATQQHDTFPWITNNIFTNKP